MSNLLALPAFFFCFLRFIMLKVSTSRYCDTYRDSVVIFIRIAIVFIIYTGYFIALTMWEVNASSNEPGLRYAIIFFLILYFSIGHILLLILIKNQKEEKSKNQKEGESKNQKEENSKNQKEGKSKRVQYVKTSIICQLIDVILDGLILAYCVSISGNFADSLPFSMEFSKLKSDNETLTLGVSFAVFICCFFDSLELIFALVVYIKLEREKSQSKAQCECNCCENNRSLQKTCKCEIQNRS